MQWLQNGISPGIQSNGIPTIRRDIDPTDPWNIFSLPYIWFWGVQRQKGWFSTGYFKICRPLPYPASHLPHVKYYSRTSHSHHQQLRNSTMSVCLPFKKESLQLTQPLDRWMKISCGCASNKVCNYCRFSRGEGAGGWAVASSFSFFTADWTKHASLNSTVAAWKNITQQATMSTDNKAEAVTKQFNLNGWV